MSIRALAALDKAVTQALAGLCFVLLLAFLIPYSAFAIPYFGDTTGAWESSGETAAGSPKGETSGSERVNCYRLTSSTNPGANSGLRHASFAYTTTPGGLPRTLKIEADGRTVTSDFDRMGRLRFLKDRKGDTFEFRYDALGRRTHVITPQNQTTNTTYTRNGRVASVREPGGDSAAFNYNATTGRLASVAYSGTGGGTVNYTSYDNNGNLLTLNENGANGITRTYDGLNRITSYTFGGNTIGYRYYPSGKLAKLIYPGGSETGVGHVEYTYNADGRLYQVIDKLDSTSSPRTTTYTWRTDGRLQSILRPNTTTRTIGYDAVGRPDTIAESAGLNWTIGYYPSDDIRTLDVTPAIPAAQLAAVPNASMTFDSANQLLTFNGQTVTHDPDGNMLSGPIPKTGAMGAYTYDSRNRLTSAGGLTYTYNAEGNRIGINGGNETTSLVVDPEGALPKVLSRTKNGITTRYVYGAGLQYEVNSSGQATYYHYDQTGNTAALSNAAGAIIERIAYSPYGTIRYRQSGFDTPFLYGGFFGVMTDANGLIAMRARYYNPVTMRFINSDPARDGLNWYAYAAGNPINFADPTGFGATAVLDAIQGGLTALGFVPVAGIIADLVNAGISAGRGDYLGAALSVGAAVPIVGDAFAAGKVAASTHRIASSSTKAVSAPVATAAKVERAVVQPARATVPNTTRGWSVGDPVNNLTSAGNVPSWSTVRARVWKNEASANAATYSEANIARMQQGLAPQRVNPTTGRLESMELHHTPAQRDGGLFDVQKVWPDEHTVVDPFRRTGN